MISDSQLQISDKLSFHILNLKFKTFTNFADLESLQYGVSICERLQVLGKKEFINIHYRSLIKSIFSD